MPFPKIEIATDSTLDEQLDAEVAEFERYFMAEPLKNEPMVRSEKAILKTYLFWKARESK